MNSRITFLVLAFLSVGTHAFAQDPQARLILHPTLTVSEHWFLTTWVIRNARTKAPSNVNLFTGIGYEDRDAGWWLEGMVQRQWNGSGNAWMLDARFQKQFRRVSLYVEPSLFLSEPAFYEFVIVEWRLGRGVGVGGETENVHRAGRDSVGVGPRVSFPLGTLGGAKLAGVAAYRIHPRERDVLRLYLSLHRRFGGSG
jgi:hypothetical protein